MGLCVFGYIYFGKVIACNEVDVSKLSLEAHVIARISWENQ